MSEEHRHGPTRAVPGWDWGEGMLLERLRFADSYSRLPALLDLAAVLPANEWLALMGEHWSVCDNIGAYIARLRRVRHLYDRTWPIAEVMTEDETAALAALPDPITVYRGCGPDNIRGWCWSTDEAVARAFPFTRRYKQEVPLLIAGTVRKRDVVALKLDREEAEIIAPRGVRIKLEQSLIR